jgi:anaerobic dimethyl sulfoxide reductase subunit A
MLQAARKPVEPITRTREEHAEYISTCSANCGGTCVLHLMVRDGRVTDVRPDARHTPCLKGLAQHEKIHHPDRLLYPLRRIGQRGAGRFERISWDDALGEITGQIERIRDQYGMPAILNWPYSGSQVVVNSKYGTDFRLFNLLGGQTRLSGSLCIGAALAGSRHTFGQTDAYNPVEDLVNSKFIILWGWNPAETTWQAGTMRAILDAKKLGIPMVAIDPRLTDTASKADEWIAIRPGTDTALALAMAHVIVRENLHDKTFIDKHVHGFERFREHVAGYSPAWAAEICGIPVQTIVSLATRYATARPAAIKPGSGLQRTSNGDQVYRALPALAAITGNVGISGGSPAGYLSSNDAGIRADDFMSAAGPEPEVVTVPVNKVADAILEGRAGGWPVDLKMAYIYQGNPVNQIGNVHKTVAALQKLDFVVVTDLFRTATTHYADIVLPAASEFEQEDLSGSPQVGYLIHMPKVIDPPGEARSDLDIFASLAERLGVGEAFGSRRSHGEWIELALRHSKLPYREFLDGINIDRLRSEGLIYFPEGAKTQMCFADRRFQTPSGKIELYSEALEKQGYFPLPTYVPPREFPGDADLGQRYPLQLVSPHSRFRAHSSYALLPRLVKDDRPEIWLHPADAGARGVDNGAAVRVFNDRGELRLPALVTDRIRPGVVCIYQGFWYRPDDPTRGGCANVLTSNNQTAIGEGSTYNTTLVEVCAEG